jgi:hypothetical protein
LKHFSPLNADPKYKIHLNRTIYDSLSLYKQENKKLDVLGQNHDQKVMELKKQISEQQENISENQATLNHLDQRCNKEHVCSTLCVKKIMSQLKI